MEEIFKTIPVTPDGGKSPRSRGKDAEPAGYHRLEKLHQLPRILFLGVEEIQTIYDREYTRMLRVIALL